MEPSYKEICQQLQGLTQNCPSLVSALSNAAALLYHSLPQINWAGFYLTKGEQLILGPFGGKPACLQIPFGRGVCGHAAQSCSTVVVEDVHTFAGHIACDAASQSEIVVPLVVNGSVVGVLDIDSPVKNRFSPEDKEGLEQCAAILSALPLWDGFVVL